MTKVFVAAAAILAAVAAGAFPEIPKASYKALGSTRGKVFSTGLVFVNGKFLKPPYRVERWGTGIRINRVPVTGQVIDWAEFLKTQEGYRPSVTPAAPQPPPPPPAAAAPVAAPPPAEASPEDPDEEEEEEEITSLDDLFDDNPRPKKKKAKPVVAQQPPPEPPAAAPVAPPPQPAPSAADGPFDGKFVKNGAVKAMIKKVNALRTEIDRHLRTGGFYFFGDRYSRISGDSRTAAKLLEILPDSLRRASSPASIQSDLRAARLDYLHELVCEDLYRNRIDYRPLHEYREKIRQEQKMMDAPKTLF